MIISGRSHTPRVEEEKEGTEETGRMKGGETQRFRTAMNPDVRTGPLACPLACSFAKLTHSQAPGNVNDLMSQNDLILSHSGREQARETGNERKLGKKRIK